MIDPVTGNVMPNNMLDVRALGQSLNQGGFNPFLSAVPPGAQSLGAPAATQVAQAPGPAVPATMPGLRNDALLAAATGMPAGGNMAAAPSIFGGRIPQGLLMALQRLSQRNPERFDARMQSPMAARFGITPEMVQNFVPPAHRQPGFGRGPDGNPNGALSLGMAPPAQGFAAPGRDAQFAAQSQIGMDSGKAKNQNIGAVTPY